MVAAVVDRALDVDHRVPGEEPFRHGLLDALVDRRNESARDPAARDRVDELVAGLGIGLDPEPAVAELPRAAGLLLVPCASAVFVMVSRYGMRTSDSFGSMPVWSFRRSSSVRSAVSPRV